MGKRFLFGLPVKNNIVLFHENHEHILKNQILPQIPFFTYKTSPETFYISIVLVFNYIKQLFHYKWVNIIKNKLTFRIFLSELINNYRLVTIKYINPKIIITFIDDSSSFHWLSKNYSDIEYFAIQNGNRINKQLEKSDYFYHDHFFCFGDYEKEQYNKYNIVVNNYYPVGSFLADYNTSVEQKLNYDLCIASVWPPHNKAQLVSIQLMDNYVARYIKEFDIKAIIALRTNDTFNKRSHQYFGNYKSEKDYYIKIYSNSLLLHERNQNNLSVYDIMNSSEVSIGFLTTTIREAYGRGKKAIYCDFTQTTKYNDYNKNLLFTNANYNDFKIKLNNLLNEPYDEYIKRNKEYSSYIMHYDPNMATHKMIRNKLDEYL